MNKLFSLSEVLNENERLIKKLAKQVALIAVYKEALKIYSITIHNQPAIDALAKGRELEKLL